MIRRHAKSDREMHFGPALRVVSGNYIAAKRRGILDGVDFGYTGEVGRLALALARLREARLGVGAPGAGAGALGALLGWRWRGCTGAWQAAARLAQTSRQGSTHHPPPCPRQVRFVVRDAVRAQLESGNIVLLSNLGFTAAGEVRCRHPRCCP
jgi:hypothetical protein